MPDGRATPDRIPDDILANFERWEPYMTPAERGAVCAVLFLSAREPSAEDIKRGQELAEEHGWLDNEATRS
jgi:hypothetical protein